MQNNAMDAGTAAILGATVGALGSGSAAFFSGWWGMRHLRVKASADESQSRRQFRFEHLRDRRGPRSDAYVEFISRAREFQEAYIELMLDVVHGQTEQTLNAANVLKEKAFKFREYGARVALEGPATLAAVTKQLEGTVSQCSTLCLIMHMKNSNLKREGNAAEVLTEHGVTLANLIEIFSNSAREALDVEYDWEE
jgi:hypothetical protein